ncbi:SPOR domain-containing protein [Candidatus Hydrogenedentota bacterium]
MRTYRFHVQRHLPDLALVVLTVIATGCQTAQNDNGTLAQDPVEASENAPVLTQYVDGSVPVGSIPLVRGARKVWNLPYLNDMISLLAPLPLFVVEATAVSYRLSRDALRSSAVENDTRPDANPKIPGARWSIQVIATSSQDRAEELARKLANLGMKEARVESTENKLYAVRVGKLSSREEAEELLKDMEASFRSYSPFVVKTQD